MFWNNGEKYEGDWKNEKLDFTLSKEKRKDFFALHCRMEVISAKPELQNRIPHMNKSHTCLSIMPNCHLSAPTQKLPHHSPQE